MVTGPRRTTPSVVYANRTSCSPFGLSRSCTSDEKRRSPARCGTLSSSTIVAAPHGVATVTGFDAFAADGFAADAFAADALVSAFAAMGRTYRRTAHASETT